MKQSTGGAVQSRVGDADHEKLANRVLLIHGGIVAGLAERKSSPINKTPTGQVKEKYAICTPGTVVLRSLLNKGGIPLRENRKIGDEIVDLKRGQQAMPQENTAWIHRFGPGRISVG
jgi:hypothetical protein